MMPNNSEDGLCVCVCMRFVSIIRALASRHFQKIDNYLYTHTHAHTQIDRHNCWAT